MKYGHSERYPQPESESPTEAQCTEADRAIPFPVPRSIDRNGVWEDIPFGGKKEVDVPAKEAGQLERRRIG
jgi:hypothetical protein